MNDVIESCKYHQHDDDRETDAKPDLLRPFRERPASHGFDRIEQDRGRSCPTRRVQRRCLPAPASVSPFTVVTVVLGSPAPTNPGITIPLFVLIGSGPIAASPFGSGCPLAACPLRGPLRTAASQRLSRQSRRYRPRLPARAEGIRDPVELPPPGQLEARSEHVRMSVAPPPEAASAPSGIGASRPRLRRRTTVGRSPCHPTRPRHRASARPSPAGAPARPRRSAQRPLCSAAGSSHHPTRRPRRPVRAPLPAAPPQAPERCSAPST